MADKVIRDKCNFVDGDINLYAHEILLQRFGKRSTRKPRTRIFTTNYDRCVEEAAKRLRFVVVDGFSHSMPQTFDPGYFAYDVVRRERSGEMPDYIENVFHLHKLHGSIDWTRERGEIVRRHEVENPLLIYPRSSKYEQAFEPPFLDMMGAFQTILRQPDTALIVIGFGFNDDHISQPIMAALRANLSLRLLVWDCGFFDEEADTTEPSLEGQKLRNRYHERMRWLISAGDPRIALLRASFEDFAQEVPDMVAETDRERHAQRMRELWHRESLFE